jgi:membrane AbrB-like protein
MPVARLLLEQSKVLSVATFGGYLFYLIGLPAPWLSGAMLFSGVMVGTGHGHALARPLRDLAMMSSGITLGASVTVETLHAFARVPASLVILAITSVCAMAATGLVLQMVFQWPRRDAMLAAAPGALSSVLAIAIEEKADIARIAIIQLFRLVMLVAVLPPLIMSAELHGLPPAYNLAWMDLEPLMLTLIIGLAGAAFATRIKLSAPLILGPMLTIGALRGLGYLPGLYPPPLSSFGFLLIGTFIGGRFEGVKRKDLVRVAPAAFLGFTVATCVAAIGAALDTVLTGMPLAESIIAFAPGGLEAMTALAFALHVDPVLVGVHHLARFLMVGIGLPLVMRLRPKLIR